MYFKKPVLKAGFANLNKSFINWSCWVFPVKSQQTPTITPLLLNLTTPVTVRLTDLVIVGKVSVCESHLNFSDTDPLCSFASSLCRDDLFLLLFAVSKRSSGTPLMVMRMCTTRGCCSHSRRRCYLCSSTYKAFPPPDIISVSISFLLSGSPRSSPPHEYYSARLRRAV